MSSESQSVEDIEVTVTPVRLPAASAEPPKDEMVQALKKMRMTLEEVLTKSGYIEGRMDESMATVRDVMRHLERQVVEFKDELSPPNTFRLWVLGEKLAWFRQHLKLNQPEEEITEAMQ